jgi:transcriptional regulator with XRE-family HTH domain
MKNRVDSKEFAGIVTDLRARMGLSQEKFAAEVGVTASTVNR